MTIENLRCLLVADFTVGGLSPFLAAADDPPVLTATIAPFGAIMPVLLDPDHLCWRSRPDIAVVWSRPDAMIAGFRRLLNGEPVAIDDVLAEVREFAERLRDVSTRVAALFVPTWTWPAHDRGLGLLNMDTRVGPAYCLMRMNTCLAEAVQDDRTIHLLDAGRWVAHAGSGASSAKLWHLGKIAFGPEVFQLAAADIKAAIRGLRGQARKLIVVDLDDTLWGGVVGDVGWENLKLGGHDPVGEAFAGFQRSLKAMTHSGIVLGITSRNTEETALEAIDCHPEMVLRRSDFAGWRINWDDKADNVARLAEELNLGLDSVVFIDNDPAERARVREALPQVLVPDWPADRLLYEHAFARLTCFDTPVVTEEDQARARMYVAERERRTARASARSLAEYHASLGLRVAVGRVGPSNLPRATQLLNKTNQMNLSTRRLSEEELLDWAARSENHAFAFRVSDRFDDYGLTGIGSISVEGRVGRIVDFVLSCRVMSRGVERAMLHVLVDRARALGLSRLVATFAETPRNAPCKRFFDEESGFIQSAPGGDYSWDLVHSYALPAHVTLSSDMTSMTSKSRQDEHVSFGAARE